MRRSPALGVTTFRTRLIAEKSTGSHTSHGRPAATFGWTSLAAESTMRASNPRTIACTMAEARMAFVSRCDAFIILADADALLKQGGSKVDDETSLLIRRIAESTSEVSPRPPLAIVLSKFDRIIQSALPPPPEKRVERSEWGPLAKRLRATWPALEEARRTGLPTEVFPVSAFPSRLNQGQPIGVMEPFAYVMRHADDRERWTPLEVPIPNDARGFATMRRWRDDP